MLNIPWIKERRDKVAETVCIRSHSPRQFTEFRPNAQRLTPARATVIAAETTSRGCLAMEIDPRYCDVAIERWEQLTGREATLVDSGSRFHQLQAVKLASVSGAA